MAAPQSNLASIQIPLPQFIIALLLIKSKPVSIPTQEYLVQLRNLIRKGRRPKYSRLAHRHLDAATYRAKAEKEAQKTILTLQARILELEGKRKAYPSFKDPDPTHASQIATVPAEKRKRKASDPGHRPQCVTKSVRRANSSSPMQSRHHVSPRTCLMSDVFATKTGVPDVPFPMEGVLQEIYILQGVIHSIQAPEAELITSCLERCFGMIELIICSLEMPEDPTQTTTVNRLARSNDRLETSPLVSIQQKISKLLPVLLQAMDHLDRAIDVQNFEGRLIYKFVKVYEVILSHVCKLSIISTIPGRTTISSHSEEKQKPVNCKRNPAETLCSQSRTILDLCELAVAMTTTLDSTKRAQGLMLEGCLSVLLKMVGSKLKGCVFGGPSRDTLDQQIWHAANDLEEAADDGLEADNPYLIYILRRVLSSTNKRSLQHPNNALLTLTKQKLQNALLHSVFGETALGLMKPSFEKPEPPAELQQLEGTEAKDWFKSEVWKLVGWDVLEDYLSRPLEGLKTDTSS